MLFLGKEHIKYPFFFFLKLYRTWNIKIMHEIYLLHTYMAISGNKLSSLFLS